MSKLNKFLLVMFLLHFAGCSSAFAQASRIVEGDALSGGVQTRNYIKNPSARKSATFGTATSDATLTRDTDSEDKLDGYASFLCDSSDENGYCEWDTYTIQEGDKTGTCEVSFDYKGDASLYMPQVYDGSSVYTPSEFAMTNASDWTTVRFNYPCGSTRKVRLTQTESGDGAAVNIGRIRWGKATNIGTVAQARWVGSIEWPSTGTAASWTATGNTSGTDVAFAANASCPTPTVSGQLTAPSTKIPGFNLPTARGVYKFVTKLQYVQGKLGDNGRSVEIAMNDGGSLNSSSTGHYVDIYTREVFQEIGTLVFEETSPGSKSFNLTTLGGTGNEVSVRCSTESGSGTSTPRIDVFYYPAEEQTAVHMSQTNYDWKDDANVPSFNGLGTITNLVYKTRRVGSELWAKGSFTTGTVSGITVASISLPPNIVIDASKITTVAAGIKVGESYSPPEGSSYIFPGSGGASGSSQILFFDGSDTSKLFFAYRSNVGVFNKDTGAGIFGSSRVVTFEFKIPVEGWTENQNAPLVVGGVTSSYGDVGKIEWIEFGGSTEPSSCSSSPCTIYRQSGAFSSVTRSNTGRYTVNINPGVFSSRASCTHSVTGQTLHTFRDHASGTDSATAVYIGSNDASGASPADAAITMICIGPR